MKDWKMEQTSLRGIANKAAQNKSYRFRNLFGLLTFEFLLWCWGFINKKASAGVDKMDAEMYAENLHGNITQLVSQVKEKTYRAKLVLRKYIPKLGGKLRPLGIPIVADKLLQLAAAKILEAIYEQDFLPCSFGYRPNLSAHHAVKELTQKLMFGHYHYILEADIKDFFNQINHEHLMAMLAMRIDDKPFLNLIRKWLKAGILDNGQVICSEMGTPQGGIISPILANIYLHHALDAWFNATVRTYCRGEVYLCRYADDFVCAFEYEQDAQRFYEALEIRLKSLGLELAADKTKIIKFSRCQIKNGLSFDFLGFEFRWGLSRRKENRSRIAIIKRRTSRQKLSASLASFKVWIKKSSRLPKDILFRKLNRKLQGYYQYYGIIGNYKSLGTFVYRITQMLFKWLNRRSQRKSYHWKGFKELVKHFGIVQPRICHDF